MISSFLGLFFSLFFQESEVCSNQVIIRYPYNIFRKELHLNLKEVEHIYVKNTSIPSCLGVYICDHSGATLTSRFCRFSRKRALSVGSELAEMFRVNMKIELNN